MAKDFKAVRLVDGGFSAQDRTLFVVEFDGVLADAVFDAYTFGSVFKVGDDFAFKGAMDFAAEEAHDVRAGEGGHAVMNERRIDLSQGRGVFEHEVGGPFALVGGPVVVHGMVFEHGVVSGIKHPRHFVQGRGPGETKLLIHEGLSFGDVLKLDKTVVAAAIGEPRFVHHASEPFAAVQTDLDAEGEPGLNPSVHKPEDGIDEVVVEGETFAQAGDELKFLGIAVTVDLEARTGFEGGEDSDQSFGDAVTLHNLSGDGFFVGGAGMQVLDWTVHFLSLARRRLTQLVGQTLGVGAKVFEKNMMIPQQSLETSDVSDGTKRSSEHQTIESVQNPSDLISMICYKTLHGVLPKRRFVFANTFYFIEDAVSIFGERGLASTAFLLGCG